MIGLAEKPQYSVGMAHNDNDAEITRAGEELVARDNG